MTEEEILHVLDHSNDGYYCSFVELGHGYSYLIDTRLTIFRDQNSRWAIAIERLGYNPRAGEIILDINYYGNCLTNLEYYNNRPTSYYSIHPIDVNSFNESLDDENLKANAKFWLVRGQAISLDYSKQEFLEAGIELETHEIRAEEIGRLVVAKNRDLFRATHNELYKSIPTDLEKILVLDAWFHKDFLLQINPNITDEHLRQTYEFNKNLTGLGEMTFESFAQSFRQQEIMNDDWNREIWETSRPSSYETWQLIARVIATGNPEHYQPTLSANTHWKNWPDSGCL